MRISGRDIMVLWHGYRREYQERLGNTGLDTPQDPQDATDAAWEQLAAFINRMTT